MGSALRAVGVQEGDTICVHSRLFKIGRPLLLGNNLLDPICLTLQESVGPQGTILMSCFSYSYCKNQEYDVLRSKTSMGALNERFRHLPEVKRTLDPIFSFAVWGHDRDLYVEKAPKSCFGPSSTYDLLLQKQGKVILFGMNDSGYSFFHFLEELAHVSYRYHKTFSGTTVYEDGHREQTEIDYYVRQLDGRRTIITNTKMRPFLKQEGLFTEVPLGNASLCMFPCAPVVDPYMRLMAQDEEALLI